ncbi:hypothetical protein J2S13_001698 [Oikeobacillus pervagus]|uniref:Uncharacterized protein n=1 Tax=Oikeobacillus pervagus TaxID=1325931 RepID=A0AAJ1WJB7_9BACI|nr:hypothetical protein [Oikeobacillus pervagus]
MKAIEPWRIIGISQCETTNFCRKSEKDGEEQE